MWLLGPVGLVALSVWLVLPQRFFVRPGLVRFVLVDASGAELPPSVGVFVIGEEPPSPWEVLRIPEGTHSVLFAPVENSFGHPLPFEPFTRTVIASGEPTTELQEVKVTARGAFMTRARKAWADTLRPPTGRHTVDVTVTWPDGRPAAGVTVRCLGAELATDLKGRATCGPTEAQPLSVWAFTPGFAAVAQLGEEDGDVALALAPAMDLDLIVHSGLAVEPVTLHSRELQEEVTVSGTPLQVSVPRARTSVCTRRSFSRFQKAQGRCEVVEPGADAGRAEVVLQLEPPGVVSFEPRLHGAPVQELVVTLDGVSPGVTPGVAQRHGVLPGRHVLVLNTRVGPERFETVFALDAGAHLDLGVLELAAP